MDEEVILGDEVLEDEVVEESEEVAEEDTDTEVAPSEETEVEVEGEAGDDERPEASSVEEAQSGEFKISEGNPYAPTPADGQPI